MYQMSRNSESLKFLEPKGPVQASNVKPLPNTGPQGGVALTHYINYFHFP
jgi:hypothetical protein